MSLRDSHFNLATGRGKGLLGRATESVRVRVGLQSRTASSVFPWWLLAVTQYCSRASPRVYMLLCRGAACGDSSPACLCSQLEAGLDCCEAVCLLESNNFPLIPVKLGWRKHILSPGLFPIIPFHAVQLAA